MGTINYYTSDYITIGQRPVDLYDLEKDAVFMRELRENYNLQPDEDATSALYDYANMITEDDRSNLDSIMKKYSFYYYHVAVKPGYYEGFSIDIENNFGLFYDDYHEKQEAQKEITEIKQFLTECAGIGLVSVYPGWCTTYRDYRETLEDIKEAIEEMRAEAKSTPTYNQWKKEA